MCAITTYRVLAKLASKSTGEVGKGMRLIASRWESLGHKPVKFYWDGEKGAIGNVDLLLPLQVEHTAGDNHWERVAERQVETERNTMRTSLHGHLICVWSVLFFQMRPTRVPQVPFGGSD